MDLSRGALDLDPLPSKKLAGAVTVKELLHFQVGDSLVAKLHSRTLGFVIFLMRGILHDLHIFQLYHKEESTSGRAGVWVSTIILKGIAQTNTELPSY